MQLFSTKLPGLNPTNQKYRKVHSILWAEFKMSKNADFIFEIEV
jgi:hypothetical protein